MFRLLGVDTGFVMCALSVADHGTSPVGAEPFFGGGFRERLTVQRGSSAADHGRDDMAVVSPELVLVCPELRELALQQLPEGRPDCLRPRLRLVEPSEDDVVIDGNASSSRAPPRCRRSASSVATQAPLSRRNGTASLVALAIAPPAAEPSA